MFKWLVDKIGFCFHDDVIIDHDNVGCVYECTKCGRIYLYRGDR